MKRFVAVTGGIAVAVCALVLAAWWPDITGAQFYAWPYPSLQTSGSGTVSVVGAASGSSSSTVGVVIDNSPALSGSAKLLSVRDGGSEKFFVDSGGNFSTGNPPGLARSWTVWGASDGYASGSSPQAYVINSGGSGIFQVNVGATDAVTNGIAMVFKTSSTWSAAGTKLVSIQNNASEKLAFDDNGATVYPQLCDTSGTNNTSSTCNQAAGRVLMTSANSAYTLTNSIVSSTSIVAAVLQSNDTTALAIKSVVPGSGSFVINTNGNCTANCIIAWWVVAK
jgi:hypothetical protein